MSSYYQSVAACRVHSSPLPPSLESPQRSRPTERRLLYELDAHAL